MALVFLALSYAGSDFMLPTAWAVCLDIGKKYAGAVMLTVSAALWLKIDPTQELIPEETTEADRQRQAA